MFEMPELDCKDGMHESEVTEVVNHNDEYFWLVWTCIYCGEEYEQPVDRDTYNLYRQRIEAVKQSRIISEV